MKIIVNCAMTADGKLATRERRQLAISCEEDLMRVHRMRNAVDAILVGVGTIIADDPRLTVKEKYVPNPKHPIRIVLDSRGRLPKEARVLDGSSKTIVYGLKGRPDIPGAEVVRVGGDKKVKVEDAVEDMEKRGMKTLMVEGGGETIWSFFKAGLVDEYHVFVGGRVVGGREAPTPVDGEGFEEAYAIKLMLLEVRKMENGALLSYRVLKK